MIGAANVIVSQDIISSYNAFITPSSLEASARKGTATTPEATANASGGIPPYTYLWSTDNVTVFISDEEGEKTKFTTTGFNITKTSQATVTVTDSNMAEVTATVELTFNFGDI